MENNELYGQNQTYGQNQAYNQGQPYGQQYSPPPARAVVYDTMPMKNNNVAITGLVLGIFSLLGCWIPFCNLVLSVAGIVCSAIGMAHKGTSSGMAIGGLVTSIVALLLSIIIMIVYFIAIVMA